MLSNYTEEFYLPRHSKTEHILRQIVLGEKGKLLHSDVCYMSNITENDTSVLSSYENIFLSSVGQYSFS